MFWARSIDTINPALQRLIVQLFQRLILISYVGAAIVSVPQWFVWTTIDMHTWSQCTTIWHKIRAIEYIQGDEPTVRM